MVVDLAVPSASFTADALVRGQLLSACFLESPRLAELLYEARLAELSFSLSFGVSGWQLVFSGFSDTLPSFAAEVAARLGDFQPDADTYSRCLESLRRSYASWRTQQPYQHVRSPPLLS